MNNIPNAASVAIFSGEQVLLIRRALPPYQGLWTLPGGRVEPGETVAECAHREICEELGLVIGKLIAVTIQVAGTWRLQVFAVYAPPDVPEPSSEIADWQWADPNSLAGLKMTPSLSTILLEAKSTLSSQSD